MRPQSKGAAARRDRVYQAIADSKGRGISSAQIADVTGIDRAQIPYAMEVLGQEGRIKRAGLGVLAVWYATEHAPQGAVPPGRGKHDADAAATPQDAAHVWANAAPLHSYRLADDWRRDPIRPAGPASVWALAQRYACAAQ